VTLERDALASVPAIALPRSMASGEFRVEEFRVPL
jgi:hypothetical protein